MLATTLLNRYRLDAEIGHGGMGIVYRAHDTLLNRPVAVKVVSNTALGTEGRARLLREARAAAQLSHINIMTVFDAGEDAERGLPFVVMELLEGQSLKHAAPTSIEQTNAIVKQICAALDHAHAHGIIHRDLKPDNVMVLPSPTQGEGSGVRVKLMDFGLAFSPSLSRLTQDNVLVGTVAYLAPEVIEGQPASVASDLYALGVLWYELLADRLPFDGGNLSTVLAQHLYAPAVPASTYNPLIPPALDLLILRLLAKQPEQRPTSASEVQETLERLNASSASIPIGIALLDRLARGRLVGREEELAEANEVWRQACAGEGQVLLISGEPGIGKTRLAHELMAQARLNGATVLLGECYAEGGAPYAPLAQVIQAALASNFSPLGRGGRLPLPAGEGRGEDEIPASILADLIVVAPALRATFPDVPPNLPLEALAEQQRIFDNVTVFFAIRAARAPLLLVIDDAHWADRATLALLRQLARRSRDRRLLIVLTYREVELNEARPLHDLLLDLNRERLETRLKLARLDKDQTRTLLATLFQEDITAEFLTGIYRETEGNPFFVEEICKALIDSGKLYRESGRWKRPGMAELGLPQSVRLAIEARVSKLPEAAQETLRLAAVLGREFEFDVLQAMSDLGEDALIEALEGAQRAQLITEVPRTARETFAFAHGLIPATLCEDLSGLRRRRLHRRAAQALEHVHPDRLDELATVLGQHYAEAGENEKAIEYLLKAGDQARRVYVYEEAIEHYQQALAFLKEQGAAGLTRAARTAMTLGGLYHTVFDFESSQQIYDEAFTLWQRVEDEQKKATLPLAPQALHLYWPEIHTFDLTLVTDANDSVLIDHLFSGLVQLSPETDILPALARRWEILEGGHRYVFHLRRDTLWSDGQTVTAHDFECAWRRTLDPATHSPNVEYLLAIKNARAVQQGIAPLEQLGIQISDDFTLRVELEEPVGYFLQLLTCPATYAIPHHTVSAYGAAWSEPAHLVTNGSFCLTEWTPGDKVVLSRNPNYRGRFSGNAARVELTLHQRLLMESQVWLDKYETGEVDITYLGPDGFKQGRCRHPAEYQIEPTASTFAIWLDVAHPPFDDARVRQAFVHAVDRKTLAEIVLCNFRLPATGGLIPPGLPGYLPDIGLAYDPERARRLLAEAGYPGGRGFPTIQAWPAGVSDQVLQYLQTQWREHLNIAITWQKLEEDAYLKPSMFHASSLFAYGWHADYLDPDNFLRVGVHQNLPGWHNQQYDQMLEATRQVSDLVERLKFYQAADRLLIQEAGIMPLFYPQLHVLIKPWVKQYPISPLGMHYWKDVIIEPH